MRELRAALQRRKKDVSHARHAAQEGLRNELKGTVTALLLSCEMALCVPDLESAPQAMTKMRTVYELAQEVRAKLDGA